ncbi:MAG: D-alanyl-D-alanine carboxypeptidase/D-alanyl-D-alanine-endopeptidase [Dehalococcoidia bacterium]
MSSPRPTHPVVVACLAVTLVLASFAPPVGARPADAPPLTSGNAFSTRPLPARVTAIMNGPLYRRSDWGLYLADRRTGEPIFEYRADQQVVPGSTTKLFAAAAALDAYGPDFRFETPVYRLGSLDGAGTLRGDLVLVASGDLTMGGRTTADGRIAWTNFDHGDADVLPTVGLTPEDPLAGLDELARQVAASGIRRVTGNVIVDARLFPQMEKDTYVLSPIMINDNIVDVIVRPGEVGGPAVVSFRPQSSAFRLLSTVRTVPAGQPIDLNLTMPQPGVLAIDGQIAADVPQALQIYQVPDPPVFARTLFVEALGRAGVAVDAPALGANPQDLLPAPGSFSAAERVAMLQSPPFSENITHILKVSQNKQADTLIFLLAIKRGLQNFDEGLAEIGVFLRRIGVDPLTISLGDGRGNDRADLFSPRAVSQLTQAMAQRPDFATFYHAMPILGVDGTEAQTLPPTSPAVGKIVGKSGTTVVGDGMNDRPVILGRGNAGYLTGKSGHEYVFALYVQNVPLGGLNDLFAVAGDLGTILDLIFEET